MSRNKGRTGATVPPGAVVLDCQAVSLALSKDRTFAAYLQSLKDEGRAFAVSALTILEATNGKTSVPALRHYLSGVYVQAVLPEDGFKGVELLGENLHGQKYAIDAAIAAMAIRIRAHRVLTSDKDDMDKLLADTGIKVTKV
ncbi:DNA-binding protein [Streptomyces sp. SYSU K21746]